MTIPLTDIQDGGASPSGPPDPRLYLPDGFGTPETPQDALRAAAALLAEEGRWRQGKFYAHDNDEHAEFKDNPFCNGWGACAVGALQLVTLGVQRFDVPDYRKPFDQDAGDWVRVTKWELPEDRYLPFTEGYALDEEYAQLSPAERVYVDAHCLLDKTANDRGYESAIVCNDAFNTTRTDVIGLFNDAAELDPSEALTRVLST